MNRVPVGWWRAWGVLLLVTAVACGACARAASTPSSVGDEGPAAELRIGYFPNVTHAPALLGVGGGFLERELGRTELVPQTFNAGPGLVNALLGGSVDLAFLGSGPAINAYAKSEGEVRLVAGAVSGGARLVVREGIDTAVELRGRTLAVPQVVGTQDIALRKWLGSEGLGVGDGAGEVRIAQLANPQTLDAFREGRIDGGWLPEPWASRLVVTGGARVLVDERDLWPGGRFPSTVVVVRDEFARRHPDTVVAALRGVLAAIEWAGTRPGEALTLLQDTVAALTGGELPEVVVAEALEAVEMTVDPLPELLPELAADSVAAGVLRDDVDLDGFVDLTLVERAAAGPAATSSVGTDGGG
ncbi:sulfonate ABC transporter substrate-binding protein [Actinoalloteichus sp. AHMU CJ021]|uniref:ABC transporter substrate-binding protein n=1 Tax=Actinoalloteichus sp. AHMU CJ021 TaxID=2072503 RepID=UPI000CA06BCD|nr:sulfonate ABC transporter substrate-binding protein [Actinoalloteichus sp. AHMU CJ021]